MSFYTDTLAKSPVFRSTGKIMDVAMLETITRNAVNAIIFDAESEHGIKLMAFETYRSAERQAALYEQGATKLKQVGVHHYGLACDLVKVVAGSPTWKGDYGFLGALAARHGLIWGGDWGQPNAHHSFIDADHVQRCSLSDQPRLFAGSWYPAADYDPRRAVRVAA